MKNKMWFNKNKSNDVDPTSYDFAKMVKVARESDPSLFHRFQTAFKQSAARHDPRDAAQPKDKEKQ
ncbi:hypothetical protein ACFQ4P_00050 [Lacticaseibacillus mingshuiensis]|uniref:Uncharacterized protein n=2 Tax=Lacticaseibacillus mingshuiensis TaxID=2799574 RepID=A0ABW4CCY7_9LACO